MKYDCSKTRDCIHEYRRLCDSHPSGCENDCPFCRISEICGFDIFESEDNIALLQIWSDEHPEKPKLTRAEHDFLASFMYPEELFIRKGGYTMQLDTAYAVGYANTTIPLRKDMFSFIKEGDNWTAENLLHLEVEDEAD